MKMFLIKNKVTKNAFWIVGCKIFQSLLSFLIGLFTARYLGPSNYGAINYAASLTAFAVPIMQLGLNETLVQEFIKFPNEEGKVLGTSLVLNTCSAFLSIVGITAFSMIANDADEETVLICFLYSLMLVFQATEMTKYWFQTKLLSKYTSIASLVAHFIVALYKIYLLVSEKSIIMFSITHAIEAAIVSALLLYLFKKVSKQRLSFSFKLGKEMLSNSRHYISSSLMIVVFQQTDKIMLRFMLDEVNVGYYSAATTCMAITGFVFGAIIDSARPWILEGKNDSDKVFDERLRILFSIIIGISLMQSIVTTVFATPLVLLMFGKDYVPTVNVLRVAVWIIALGNIGTVRNIWVLANGKQKYLPIINIFGALSNVVLNFIMIPRAGAIGAAVASLITQFFTNVIMTYIIKPIRPNNKIMLQSLNPKYLFSAAKMLLRK